MPSKPRYAYHRQSRNRAFRKSKEKRRAKDVFKAFVMGLGLLLPVLLYVGFQVESWRLRKTIEETRQETLQLREENRKLRTTRARLESLERIEHEARTRLGMIDPESGQMINVHVADAPTQRLARHQDTP